jgi:hypothetical protein
MNINRRYQLSTDFGPPSCAVAFLSLAFTTSHPLAAEVGQTAKVALIRVPNGGIQPRVAVDSAGTVHMVYYTGDPSHGNLYYVRSHDGGATFSAPLRVNSTPGSAVATGNIRGASIAIGRNGRVHIAWNGSHALTPGLPFGREPMLYTRLNDPGTAFEPQRDLIQIARGIDGGGSVAADSSGSVYVLWHAPAPGAEGEGNRRVWIARSTDDGATFERERPVWDQATGACGCCGLDAFADHKGSVYVLYRSAMETVHRDIYLLISRDHGRNFEGSDISPWNVGYCVMSSQSFAEGPAGVLAAWETEKQVYYGRINPASARILPVAAPGSGENRKYPVVAASTQGEMIFAWTEGMGWKKGGSVAWQVYDADGRPTAEHGKADGVAVWSLVAAFARPDGRFTIVY